MNERVKEARLYSTRRRPNEARKEREKRKWKKKREREKTMLPWPTNARTCKPLNEAKEREQIKALSSNFKASSSNTNNEISRVMDVVQFAASANFVRECALFHRASFLMAHLPNWLKRAKKKFSFSFLICLTRVYYRQFLKLYIELNFHVSRD